MWVFQTKIAIACIVAKGSVFKAGREINKRAHTLFILTQIPTPPPFEIQLVGPMKARRPPLSPLHGILLCCSSGSSVAANLVRLCSCLITTTLEGAAGPSVCVCADFQSSVMFLPRCWTESDIFVKRLQISIQIMKSVRYSDLVNVVGAFFIFLLRRAYVCVCVWVWDCGCVCMPRILGHMFRFIEHVPWRLLLAAHPHTHTTHTNTHTHTHIQPPSPHSCSDVCVSFVKSCIVGIVIKSPNVLTYAKMAPRHLSLSLSLPSRLQAWIIRLKIFTPLSPCCHKLAPVMSRRIGGKTLFRRKTKT